MIFDPGHQRIGRNDPGTLTSKENLAIAVGTVGQQRNPETPRRCVFAIKHQAPGV